jgi:hypothetical protein
MRKHSAVASLAIIGAALVAAFVPTRADRVERLFANGLYPAIQPRLTALSNVVPIALFDVLLVAATAVVIMWLARALAQLKKDGWWFPVRIGTLAAVLYLIFLAVWGFNYRREPLRRTLPFRQERVTHEALRQLAARTADELNAIYPQLPAAWPAWDDLPRQLEPSFERARASAGPRWRVELGRPKHSLLNAYFKRTAVDGMVDPFFLEVLVNQDVLPTERPFIVSHEWGHLAGRADESEASFLGWLTCMNGPLWARYSAWISLYGTIVAGLPSDEQRAITATLEPGPRRDLVALSERIARQSSVVARRVSQLTYDRFLKANRLREGVASYGLVVTLLLGTAVEVPSLDSQLPR